MYTHELKAMRFIAKTPNTNKPQNFFHFLALHHLCIYSGYSTFFLGVKNIVAILINVRVKFFRFTIFFVRIYIKASTVTMCRLLYTNSYQYCSEINSRNALGENLLYSFSRDSYVTKKVLQKYYSQLAHQDLVWTFFNYTFSIIVFLGYSAALCSFDTILFFFENRTGNEISLVILTTVWLDYENMAIMIWFGSSWYRSGYLLLTRFRWLDQCSHLLILLWSLVTTSCTRNLYIDSL